MRALPEGRRSDENKNRQRLSVRRGLQQHDVQPGPGSDPAKDVPFELLLAFTRHLIRMTVSSDALSLAIHAAFDETKATPLQITAFKKAVMATRYTNSIWPKDF